MKIAREYHTPHSEGVFIAIDKLATILYKSAWSRKHIKDEVAASRVVKKHRQLTRQSVLKNKPSLLQKTIVVVCATSSFGLVLMWPYVFEWLRVNPLEPSGVFWRIYFYLIGGPFELSSFSYGCGQHTTSIVGTSVFYNGALGLIAAIIASLVTKKRFYLYTTIFFIVLFLTLNYFWNTSWIAHCLWERF